MKALIVGANGQLGTALRQKLPDAIALGREELDIMDMAALEVFDWSQVDTILNAAGSIDVDGAETPEGREAVWRINAQAVGNLARIAVKHDLTLVHASSDYVFDGRSKQPHSEDELVAPLGVYGQAKAAGDIAAGVAPKHYIVRVAWFIGNGPNFVRTMVNLAGRNVSPSVVKDQIGRLTFADQAADGILHLLKVRAPYGIYNLTNDGKPAAWDEVTRTIFDDIGRSDLTVTGITTAEYFANKPTAAPRPLNSVMDLTKIKATGLVLRDWRDDLKAYLKVLS